MCYMIKDVTIRLKFNHNYKNVQIMDVTFWCNTKTSYHICISKNFKPIMDSYIHSFIFMQDDIPLFIVGAQSRAFQPPEERMEVHMIVNKVRLKKKV